MTIADRLRSIGKLLETKDRVRTPAGMRRWGLPMDAHIPGTPYTDDDPEPVKKRQRATSEPTGKTPRRKPAAAEPAPKKATAKTTAKAPAKSKVSATAERAKKLSGAGATPTKKAPAKSAPKAKPVKVDDPYANPEKGAGKRMQNDAAANTEPDGRVRAWGPKKKGQAFRRANVKRKPGQVEVIDYVSAGELNKIRALAVKRGNELSPMPSFYDIRDNKRLQAEGGVGSTNALDTLRGNNVARGQNSWDVYIAYGGYDEESGVDKGYVPCVGCGVKMSWHGNPDYEGGQYPKFEQDKIVVGAMGGSYNPQNIVPMCAGCNNQRGPKPMWDSPAFPGSKPKWFNAKYQRLMDSIQPPRPSNGTAKDEKRWRNELNAMRRPGSQVKPPNWSPPVPEGMRASDFGRPEKDKSATPMPVPPGPAGRSGEKSLRFTNLVIRAIKSMTPGDESDVAEDGDRVSAQLFNFDGRHNNGDNIWPPDVLDVTKQVVGTLVIEDVDSAFGEYERMAVIGDDGDRNFIEPDTCILITKGSVLPVATKAAILELKLAGGSNGPATGASESLNRYWTRGEGLARWANTATPYRSLVAALRKEGVPGHMVNGLAAKYYRTVKGEWPGKKGGDKE